MSEMVAWMQTHWYQLGVLLAQCAVPVALAWFGRKALKTMRASQEQIGALLKMTLTGANPERNSAPAIGERPAIAAPDLTVPERRGIAEGIAAAWHGGIGWLQAPMSRGGPGPFRRVIRWLQAPAGS